MLVIDGMKKGDSCKDSIIKASKDMKNRTFSSCYTRWHKKLKNESLNNLYEKSEIEKNFLNVVLELQKENHTLNMRISRLERKFDKLTKNEKQINRIGFYQD